MKVAIVCPYAVDRPGGVQGQAVQLVTWLRQAGHDAFLVAPGDGGGPEGTIYLGPAVELPANGSVVPIVLRPGVRSQVVNAVRTADVVHIHEPLVPMASIGALSDGTPPKVGSFFADMASWASLLGRAVRPLPQRLMDRLDVVTAVSPVAAASIEPYVSQVSIVPCGIDTGSYVLNEPRHPRRVVFLGRDEPRKGLDVLLAAWPQIHARVDGSELVVLGASREPRAGVVFRGTVSDVEKRRVLASAAVLVAPNLYGESFGIVLLEGMAAGCAIIASALPAFAFVLDGAGVLVPSGDADRLAQAVVALLSDPEERYCYMQRGRRRVMAFDRRRVLEGYLEAYHAALEACRPAAVATSG